MWCSIPFFYLQLNFDIIFLFNPFFLSPSNPPNPPPSPPPQQVAVPSLSGVGAMVRPVTGADVGIRRAEIRPGLREVILCKDQDGKVGLRLRAIDNVSRASQTQTSIDHSFIYSALTEIHT